MELLRDRRMTPPDGKPDRRECWSCGEYFDYDPDDVSGGGEIDGRPTCPGCMEHICSYCEQWSAAPLKNGVCQYCYGAMQEEAEDYRRELRDEVAKEG